MLPTISDGITVYFIVAGIPDENVILACAAIDGFTVPAIRTVYKVIAVAADQHVRPAAPVEFVGTIIAMEVVTPSAAV